MGRHCGGRLTVEEKQELWLRWQRGETLIEIGHALARRPQQVYTMLRKAGGIEPAPRLHRAGSLTAADREEVSRGLTAGLTLRAIASELGRAASTISREVARNGGRHRYRAVLAGERALQVARRPKPCLLSVQGPLA